MQQPSDEWRTLTWRDFERYWEESALAFRCLCGKEDLQVSDEEKRCGACGRTYRLVQRLEVKDAV